MQELAKQFIHIMSTQLSAAIEAAQSFKILSFQANKQGTKDSGFRPHSVMRISDEEVFTIRDFVTNGTQMKGEILSFEFLEGSVFVITTWSNIGMDLDSLSKVIQLPSQHQVGDKVKFLINQTFGENPYPFTAEVKAVHFYSGKVKYDLEIPIENEPPTRVYNIDSCFVLPK